MGVRWMAWKLALCVWLANRWFETGIQFLEINATTILFPIAIARRIKSATAVNLDRLPVIPSRLTRFGGYCRLRCWVGIAMCHGWLSGIESLEVDGQVAMRGDLCALQDRAAVRARHCIKPGSPAPRARCRDKAREEPQNLNARGRF